MAILLPLTLCQNPLYEKRAASDCVKTHWQALDQTPRLVRGVCFCAEKGFSAHQLHHLLGTQDGDRSLEVVSGHGQSHFSSCPFELSQQEAPVPK